MEDCLFCNMASGAMDVPKLHDDELVFAIRDINPRAPVHLLIIFFVMVDRTIVPAYLMLGYWFAIQVIGGLPALASDGGGVAFWAHVGGFLAGIALVPVFAKRDRVAAHRQLLERRALR